MIYTHTQPRRFYEAAPGSRAHQMSLENHAQDKKEDLLDRILEKGGTIRTQQGFEISRDESTGGLTVDGKPATFVDAAEQLRLDQILED
jgi:hypothetical protein